VLEHSLVQRLRIKIAAIPGARKAFDTLRLIFAPTFREDGLSTSHNCDFTGDPQFLRANEAAQKHERGVSIRWRMHVTQWAGFHAMHLGGDFVECGVNRGFLSASVMSYLDFKSLRSRKFFLFDTYSGLVESLVTEEDVAAHRHEYTDCYDFVVEAFKPYPNVIIVRGVVPDSLRTVEIDRVAYLSIDMNCVQPEIAAMEYFWPKLVAGGIVIIDDYGFAGHEAQKRAADKFAEAVGAKILSLPTGQGLLLKPETTNLSSDPAGSR
jgi:hypothetical protein